MMEIFKYLIAPLVAALIMLTAQFFIQPLIQEKIKAQEELWLHKKQIYIKAIELIDKRFDSMKLRDSKPIQDSPTNEEMNTVYRELLMVCDKEEILIDFQKFMDFSIDGYCSPANRGKFIKLLREDLGKSKLLIDDEKIPYFREYSNK